MSDSRKYYYLKFKEGYFDQDHIKFLESMDNGYIYSLILIKLYLKSIKHNGQLRVNEYVPYRAQDVGMLSKIIGHDPDHVMKAINAGSSLGIIEIMSTGEMWIADIQNFIGTSSTEADRIRSYREQIKELSSPPSNNEQNDGKNEGVQMYDKCTPELDIDLDIDNISDLVETRSEDGVQSSKPSHSEVRLNTDSLTKSPKESKTKGKAKDARYGSKGRKAPCVAPAVAECVTDADKLWSVVYQYRKAWGTLPIDAKGKTILYKHGRTHCEEILKTVSYDEAVAIFQWAFKDTFWGGKLIRPDQFPTIRASYLKDKEKPVTRMR